MARAIERTATFPASNAITSLQERAEKHAHGVFHKYEITRNKYNRELALPIRTAIETVLKGNPKALPQNALVNIATGALMMDVIKKTLTDQVGAFSLLGDTADPRGVRQAAIHEHAVHLMQGWKMEHDEAVGNLQKGVNRAVNAPNGHEQHLKNMETTALQALMQGAVEQVRKTSNPKILATIEQIQHGLNTHASKTEMKRLWNELKQNVAAEILGENSPLYKNDRGVQIISDTVHTLAQKLGLEETMQSLSFFDKYTLLNSFADKERGFDAFARFSKRAWATVGFLILVTMLLTACEKASPPTPPDGTSIPIPGATDDDRTPAFTTPHNPNITPTTISGPGPYLTGTPEGPQILPFPTDITIVKAVQGLAQNMSLPDWIQSDSGLMADVGRTVDTHQAWCDIPKPCDGTVTAVYSQDLQMWRTLILDDDGHVASWMLIHTDTGDRWAEQGIWDSLLEGIPPAEIQQMIADGDIEFTLPPHTIADSHFEAIWQNGYLVLVEVDHDGNPFQWQDLHGDMHLLVEAELPTPDYHIGIQADGTIALNHIDLSARFADANHDGVMDGIPQTQIDQELAFLASHPEITGAGNIVGQSIEGSGTLPYKTLSITVDRNNILAINQNGNMYEMVVAQNSPNNESVAIFHVIIDPQAMQYYLDHAPSDIAEQMKERLLSPTIIEGLINGSIQSIKIPISMNSDANVNLQNDPAFARVKQVVEAEGDDLTALNLFAKGYFPEDVNQQRQTINNTTFISAYATIVEP